MAAAAHDVHGGAAEDDCDVAVVIGTAHRGAGTGQLVEQRGGGQAVGVPRSHTDHVQAGVHGVEERVG
ncbi:MAG TPA: hypothetical protein VGN35_01285 [Jatrophihabitantaceae bacterium]|nr:hypothetical protein [Jatrophihabitantaceae bacterium]